jgi:hypothetical protein
MLVFCALEDLSPAFDVAFAGVAKGVSFPQPPEKQAWGGTLAFPSDPDGNILTLVG